MIGWLAVERTRAQRGMPAVRRIAVRLLARDVQHGEALGARRDPTHRGGLTLTKGSTAVTVTDFTIATAPAPPAPGPAPPRGRGLAVPRHYLAHATIMRT